MQKSVTRWWIPAAMLAAAAAAGSMSNTVRNRPDPQAEREAAGVTDPASAESLARRASRPGDSASGLTLADCWLRGGVVQLDRIDCLSRGGRVEKPPEQAPATAGVRTGNGVTFGGAEPSRSWTPPQSGTVARPGSTANDDSWGRSSSRSSSDGSGLQRSSGGRYSGSTARRSSGSSSRRSGGSPNRR